MYQEDINQLLKGARAKFTLYRQHPGGFFLSSILAGLYIGFGICFVFSLAGLLGGFLGTKVLMGFCFSVALSLVVVAGGELFTGNCLVMTLPLAKKELSLKNFLSLMAFCWLGNLMGSLLCALFFLGSGLYSPGVQEAVLEAALLKTSLGFFPLLCRSILCNTLVCLAIWSCNRIKDGAGKILMVILCIACFFISGYEHSIANMTLFFISALGDGSIPLSAYVYNLLLATLGNFIGGAFLVALPYLFIASKPDKSTNFKEDL